MDVDVFRKKLRNGIKNHHPQSPLAYALKRQNTIRWGNKADPFQPIERKHRIAPKVFRELIDLNWSFVIQTKCTDTLKDYEGFLVEAHKKELVTVMPIISPGFDRDWEVFEHELTSHPSNRLQYLKYLKTKYGIPVGVNGEPFIPGYHTIEDFENMMPLLRKYNVTSYNTYNFHFNDFVAKRLAENTDLDLVKIWEGNQDKNWAPIQRQLIEIAKANDIVLGCPDFVNSGPEYYQDCNTCCGINVPKPTTFNAHEWKRQLQKGVDPDVILATTWDGVGDYELGEKVMYGRTKQMYTMADAGMVTESKKGLLF